MQVELGWLMVGVVIGLFGTIMIAVLAVEHDQERQEHDQEEERDENR